MIKATFSLLWILAAIIIPRSNVARAQASGSEITGIRFLDEYILKNNLNFEKTTVGGLSGIDYNKERNEYYVITDDESKINPARFYTFQIRIAQDKIDTVIITKKSFLKDRDGHDFQTGKIDPEALRYHDGHFIWSSEGIRFATGKNPLLINPQVYLADKNGVATDTFQLPPQVKVSSKLTGVRGNGAFEGLDVTPDGKYLYVSVEETLLQDGPGAGTGDSSAVVRIIKFDIKTRKPIAQYAYRIDPVARPAKPAGAFKINGISDILCLDNDKLLIVERSFSSGHFIFTIKVYVADLSKAQDISAMQSLKGQNIRTAPKRLLLNMDSLKNVSPDNIEGVTFGPRLSNNKRSLIFIADNNFKFFEKNQLLLFEVNEQ